MRPFLLHIICIVMLFSSCNWVNDDLSELPYRDLVEKSRIPYNITDVDAASSQVGDITIFAFDKNNKYVDRLDVDSIALHQGYCMVRVVQFRGAIICSCGEEPPTVNTGSLISKPVRRNGNHCSFH